MSRFITLTALALLATTGAPSVASSAGSVRTVHAHYGNLVVTLSVRSAGQTVQARARVTNDGSAPYRYTAGCAPPFLQVQAQTLSGHHVFGWAPAQAQCFALAIRFLQPGASLRQKTWFTITEPTRVFARIAVHGVPGGYVATRAILVRPSS